MGISNGCRSALFLFVLFTSQIVYSQSSSQKTIDTKKLFNEAVEKYKNQDFENAYIDFVKVLATDKTNNEAVLLAGISAYQIGKNEEAISYLENPNIPNTNFDKMSFLGNCYANIGNKEKAIAFLDLALQIDNSSYDAYERKGRVLLFQYQDSKLALPILKKAVELSENPYSLYHLGIAYSRLENYEDAKKVFLLSQKIMKDNNVDDKWLSDNLIWALGKTENKEPLVF